MRLRRVLTWTLVALVLAVLLGAGVLYLLASWVPSNYRPSALTHREKEQRVVKQFVSALTDFHNRVQEGPAVEVGYSERLLNDFLASMDEIAATAPNARRGRVYAFLDNAGLADPAVALDDGVVTLMVRSTRYNKVLSAELVLEMKGPERLAVRLKQVRVGRLPVSRFAVRGYLDRFQQRLEDRVAGLETAEAPAGMLSSADLAEAMAAVITAVDGEPITTVLPREIGGRRLRLDELEADDGTLRLRFSRVGP